MSQNEKLKARAHTDLRTPSVDVDAQRRSFAFGNCSIENPRVTRELVIREDKRLRARVAR
jgi:hypothetical protein